MSLKKNFKEGGVIVPMITPFISSGKVDIPAVEKIVSYLARAGVSIFVQGTTGEGLSIPNEERVHFVQATTKAADNQATIFAGISHQSFVDSVELAKQFFEYGVDFVVAHLPTYYGLSDVLIEEYFMKLADAIPGPLLIYNIPQTVHMSISIEVVEKLSHHPNIYGIKDSEPDLQRLYDLINMTRDRDDFSHYLGWASQAVEAISLGSDGIVPSTGNIIPHLYKELYEIIKEGKKEEANKLQEEIDSVSRIYQGGKSLPESLSALKVIMEHFNFCEPYVLPPLKACDQEDKKILQSEIYSNKCLSSLNIE